MRLTISWSTSRGQSSGVPSTHFVEPAGLESRANTETLTRHSLPVSTPRTRASRSRTISFMCGRFTLRTPLTVLAKQFQFELDFADSGPRYSSEDAQ